MDAQKMGAFIAQCRKETQMTQEQLAQRLQVTDKAVSRWERGVGFPDITTIEPLAQALGVEVLELQALFQGFGRMVMEIGRDIPEAISLYRKMGYREIETLTIFADNKDTLCMEKELL